MSCTVAGSRCAVSAAQAPALPETVDDVEPMPDRDLGVVTAGLFVVTPAQGLLFPEVAR